MRFGPIAVREAKGAVLAHATLAGDRRLPKAHVLSAEDVSALLAADVESVVAAVLEPGDLGEDEAARRIAAAMRMPGAAARPPATGRVNIHAAASGLLEVDRVLVDALNAIDPAITLATLAVFARVETGQMVATVKIIPFAVSGRKVAEAERLLAGGEALRVHPWRAMRFGLVQTVLPGLKESVLAKTARITAERLARGGGSLGEERRTPHEAGAVAQALEVLAASHDGVLVFGASALCDDDDVIPSAIRQAGGRVIRAGMPVDPGNLLVLGEVAGRPVIGAPGCARSPKENGFDWILDRIAAGVAVGADDIACMGVGGLLLEIPTRPQPREPAVAATAALDVHAVVLAAGRSSRMAGPNKLMALFDGVPLIRRVAECAIAAPVAGTVVVTGHQQARIREALEGLGARFAHNPDFAAGLSSSLKAGLAALPLDAAGALVMLGDMPGVSAADLGRMLSAFRAAGGRSIVRASHDGKRGNPVILPRALFAEVARLEGDTGARHLIEAGLAPVIDVEIGEAAFVDVDTREAMANAGGVLQD